MSTSPFDLNKSFNEHDEDKDFVDDKNGILGEQQIAKNLTNFASTADGTKFAYLNLSVPGCSLRDIRSLSNYKDLQYLDLSCNKLADLSVLSQLPYLLYLNVSNNKLEKLFDFLPPYNLKEANFSFNCIREIGNLSNYHYLQVLELNNNQIHKIEGLEFCHRLKSLNLAHNKIRKIEGLENLPLVNLDLRFNQIREIEGLDSLKSLRFLNLSSNLIKSLKRIPEKHEFIEKIDLENNKISNLLEIEHLVNLNLLRDLNLHNNPAKEIEDYRLAVVFKLPKLTVLDRRRVDALEKLNAVNMFQPSAEYVASRDHMTNFIFNMIQDHKVKESTLPNLDSPYPILILCGPEGSGAAEMARKLAKEYSEYFDYVANFTTREPRSNETNKFAYNFINIEEFEQNVIQGKFICCNEYNDNWYGLQWDSIEAVAHQGLACVTQMELESLLSFKQYYFEPRCVLVLTLDENKQLERLLSEGCANKAECELALSRTNWYKEYNQLHPGFFDAVIVSDDLNQGYETLRNLVLNYLGVNSNEENNEQESRALANNNNNAQRQYSKNVLGSRTRTIDEFSNNNTANNREMLDMQRTDSFLPSNTSTANRSQLSHMSIESLSQMYNQTMRLKFGSAPAQLLLSEGREAQLSREKRSSALKKQFRLSNDVSVRSQMSQNVSKQALGTLSSSSWLKKDDPSILTVDTTTINENRNRKNTLNQKPVVLGKGNDARISYNQHVASSDSDSNNDDHDDDHDDDDDEDVLIMNNRNKRLSSNYSNGSKLTSPNPVK